MSRSYHAKAVCGGDAPSPSVECDAFVAIPKPVSGEAPLARSATRSSQLHIANRQHTRKINRRLLKKITRALLAELELEKAEIGICLVAATEMTRLNETFLRHAGSTDVITFDYRFVVPPSGGSQRGVVPAQKNRLKPGQQTLHGEIFVCVEEAVLQARKFGTSWQSEVVRYLVHGLLHLTGFDDSSAGARRKMKREENRRLGELSRRFTLAQLSRPARIPA